MYLQIRDLRWQQTNYGKDLVIKQIGLYKDDGEFVRMIKIDSEILRDIIKQSKLTFSSDNLFSQNTLC